MKGAPQLSANTMMAKSGLHQTRVMWRPTAEEKACARLEKRIKVVNRKQPEKVCGRHMFFKSLAQGCASEMGLADDLFGFEEAQEIMVVHANHYKKCRLM